MCYHRFLALRCNTCAFAATGAHGNSTGNVWQPIAPTSPHHSYHYTHEIINMRKSQPWHWFILCSLFFCHFSRPSLSLPTFLFITPSNRQFELQSVRLQVWCLIFSSRTRISPFYCYLSSYRCITRSLHLCRASLLSTAVCLASGPLLDLCLSDVHLSFPLLSVRLQVHCPFFNTPTHICPFHRYFSATGALPTLYLYGAYPLFSPIAV